MNCLEVVSGNGTKIIIDPNAFPSKPGDKMLGQLVDAVIRTEGENDRRKEELKKRQAELIEIIEGLVKENARLNEIYTSEDKNLKQYCISSQAEIQAKKNKLKEMENAESKIDSETRILEANIVSQKALNEKIKAELMANLMAAVPLPPVVIKKCRSLGISGFF